MKMRIKRFELELELGINLSHMTSITSMDFSQRCDYFYTTFDCYFHASLRPPTSVISSSSALVMILQLFLVTASAYQVEIACTIHYMHDSIPMPENIMTLVFTNLNSDVIAISVSYILG